MNVYIKRLLIGTFLWTIVIAVIYILFKLSIEGYLDKPVEIFIMVFVLVCVFFILYVTGYEYEDRFDFI